MDSFGDVDDEATIRAEEARLLEARRRVAAARQQQAVTPASRVPPHLRGREEPGVSGGEIRPASPEELAAMGIPPVMPPEGEPLIPRGPVMDAALVQPPETISGRGRGRGRAAPDTLPRLNPVGDGKDSRNEKFRPPR